MSNFFTTINLWWITWTEYINWCWKMSKASNNTKILTLRASICTIQVELIQYEMNGYDFEIKIWHAEVDRFEHS